jgi:hypothetical protein
MYFCLFYVFLQIFAVIGQHFYRHARAPDATLKRSLLSAGAVPHHSRLLVLARGTHLPCASTVCNVVCSPAPVHFPGQHSPREHQQSASLGGHSHQFRGSKHREGARRHTPPTMSYLPQKPANERVYQTGARAVVNTQPGERITAEPDTHVCCEV